MGTNSGISEATVAKKAAKGNPSPRGLVCDEVRQSVTKNQKLKATETHPLNPSAWIRTIMELANRSTK